MPRQQRLSPPSGCGKFPYGEQPFTYPPGARCAGTPPDSGRFKAMADLNKVFLIGRLTQDPELRYTPNGTAVSDLRLATSRTWTGKDGERREDTLFIDVTVWNRQAENCCQYLKKGRQVHVEGFLKSESWETQAGEKRTKIKVEADRVQFLDRRDDAGGDPPAHDDDYAPPAREPRGAPPPPRSAAPPPRGAGPGGGARPPGARGGKGRPRGPTRGTPPARRPAGPPPVPDPEDEDIPF